MKRKSYGIKLTHKETKDICFVPNEAEFGVSETGQIIRKVSKEDARKFKKLMKNKHFAEQVMKQQQQGEKS
jgi:hypothetical protein